jgi:GNAT superfamily N-acetyltransferase
MSDSGPIRRPVPLTRGHSHDDFDCGSASLDEYLRRYAWSDQRAGSARTYVAIEAGRVVGYYTLAYGSVEHESAPARIQKGLARHPIPVIVLARLAVDRVCQKRGLGKGLLKDALLRTLQAAEIAGLRAVLVHAKDEDARRFYIRFGFEPSPTDSFHLMLLLKDLRRIVAG